MRKHLVLTEHDGTMLASDSFKFQRMFCLDFDVREPSVGPSAGIQWGFIDLIKSIIMVVPMLSQVTLYHTVRMILQRKSIIENEPFIVSPLSY